MRRALNDPRPLCRALTESLTSGDKKLAASSVATGIKKASNVGSSHVETEFITAKELRAHLRNNELPPSYRKEINYALSFAISDGIRSAVAPEYGEVIFEGYLSGSGHKFEKVAVASLVAMAKKFPKERPTAQALLKLASF